MKKITLLATTLLAATFLVACNESSTKTNEVSKVSSNRELKKSEGKAKIQPAKDFKNTPIGEYKLADNNLYGAWPDNTKLVIDDSVVEVLDPSSVFTKYLIHLNGDIDNLNIKKSPHSPSLNFECEEIMYKKQPFKRSFSYTHFIKIVR